MNEFYKVLLKDSQAPSFRSRPSAPDTPSSNQPLKGGKTAAQGEWVGHAGEGRCTTTDEAQSSQARILCNDAVE